MTDIMHYTQRLDKIYQEHADYIVAHPAQIEPDYETFCSYAKADRALYLAVRDLLDDLKADSLVIDKHTTQAQADYIAAREDAALEHAS